MSARFDNRLLKIVFFVHNPFSITNITAIFGFFFDPSNYKINMLLLLENTLKEDLYPACRLLPMSVDRVHAFPLLDKNARCAHSLAFFAFQLA
jgi:hypothetical protein